MSTHPRSLRADGTTVLEIIRRVGLSRSSDRALGAWRPHFGLF